MPIVDIYVPDDVIAGEKQEQLARELVTCLVRHEGFGDPAPDHVQRISTAYIHRLPNNSVHTIAESQAKVVRVHVTFHPGGLDKDRMRAFIAEATQIVTDVSEDPALFDQTWVALAETIEGGWGISGKSIRDSA